MNLPPVFYTVLAQTDRWKEMGRDFRADHSKLDATLLIVSVVVLIGVLIFMWILNRAMTQQEGPRLYNDPKQLFRDLCRAHELTGGQRRLLLAIARSQKLQQPAMLFVEPDRLTAAQAAKEFRRYKGTLGKLSSALFNDLGVEPGKRI